MLSRLLSPAVRLLAGLRYAQKFLLLGALSLLVMGQLLYNEYAALERTVATARHELAGIAAIEPLARLVQAMQQHRGLSSAVLNGNAGMREARAGKAREVGELLPAAEARIPASLLAGEAWRGIRSRWERLKEEGERLPLAENVALHTAAIDQLLVFQVAVADELGVTFDPEVDSYYLIDTAVNKLPQALERLGQLRAQGVGVLSRKTISEQQRIELGGLLAEYQGALKFLRINLGKAARYNPALAAGIGATSDEIGAAGERLSQLIRDDIVGGVFATEPQAYFEQVTATIDTGYRRMYETLLPALGKLVEARVERARRELAVTLVVSLSLLALIAYFSLGMYHETMASLQALTGGARRIAGGDLTVRIGLRSRDEHGDLGESFNEMATAFGKLLQNVQAGAHQVYGTAVSIAGASGQIAQASGLQSEAASKMAAAIEEMSVGIEHISQNARDAHAISTRAGELSAQGGEVVLAVVADIEKIAAAVNQSAAVIGDLGRQSQQISAIIGAIKEIADQTNLLALNAAIEAARAGESGRGFAVVADEVRKLAERTGGATQEIAGMITAIQGGAESAVASMGEGVERVTEGVQLAHRAGDAMRQIQQGACQVVDMVREISEALHEQSIGSQEIATNVERIAQMSESNNSVVAANTTTVKQLESLAAGLESEAARFRVK